MNNKIEQFKKRNQKRNAHLYSPEMIEGIDYILCPVSRERLSMIKRSYVERVLCMNMQDYDNLYPTLQKVAKRRSENIKISLKEVDLATGLTKYELSQTKARAILSQVDSTGKSGYKKKGEKTRATHMKNVDALGRNGYQRQVHARLTTITENGLTIEQNAHKKQQESLLKKGITRVVGASKLSKKILKPVIEYLDNHSMKYFFDKTEYVVNYEDKIYFYDLTIPDLNLVVEYQSSAWHADPRMSDEDWNKWSPPRGKKKLAKDTLDYDYDKARTIYKLRGFTMHYIWQNSQTEDIEQLLCLLKTLNMKS